jgi:hypothetical protein
VKRGEAKNRGESVEFGFVGQLMRCVRELYTIANVHQNCSFAHKGKCICRSHGVEERNKRWVFEPVRQRVFGFLPQNSTICRETEDVLGKRDDVVELLLRKGSVVDLFTVDEPIKVLEAGLEITVPILIAV